MHREFRRIAPLVFSLGLLACATTGEPMVGSSSARTLYVAVDGDDANAGGTDAPFLTISRAAALARPGDTVVVREGTYREWVKPARGGTADAPITYEAAEGAEVIVLGSERVSGWEASQREGEDGATIWSVRLDGAFFGDYNPFALGIRHPEYVEADENGDGWGWLRYGREQHRGEILLNGHALREVNPEEGLQEPLTWRAVVDGDTTVLVANFGDDDPNQEAVEVTTRPYAFFPERAGLGHITVRGMTFMNVANHWAPPTVHQPGAIGANGGHHWVFEDNTVLNARAVCLSLGIPSGEADQDASGHHIVRGNVIMRCGQGGIAGQGWNSHSLIAENHIEDVNHRRSFGGFETSAIKFHNAVGTVVTGNYVRGVYTGNVEQGGARGIWIDYENKNVRVTRNVVLETDDFSILIEANWSGPFLVDNNVTKGGILGNMSTVNDAWAHNLFIDGHGFWLNQTYGDRPKIDNSRWMNNIMASSGFGEAPDRVIERFGAETYLIPDDGSVLFQHNAFVDGSTPVPIDAERLVIDEAMNADVTIAEDGVVVSFLAPAALAEAGVAIHDADSLGVDIRDAAGEPVTLDDDILGAARSADTKLGPFASFESGRNDITVFHFTDRYRRALELLGAETNQN